MLPGDKMWNIYENLWCYPYIKSQWISKGRYSMDHEYKLDTYHMHAERKREARFLKLGKTKGHTGWDVKGVDQIPEPKSEICSVFQGPDGTQTWKVKQPDWPYP